MTPLFKKLNLKDQQEILVLNPPKSFEAELKKLAGIKVLRKIPEAKDITFSLAFVTRQKEIDMNIRAIAGKAKGDAVVWFAYPKGTSKKYTCDFNRDTGWSEVGKAGFEGVRMVAIDEDWSAVRFRRAEFIKTMSRDKKHAMSRTGKKKTTSNKQ